MISFIVNPKAGGGRVGKEWPKLTAELTRRWGNSYRCRYTERNLDATALAREELRQGVETVVAVGGDGTLHEVVNGFFVDGQPVNPNAAVAVLCFGTGADFVRTLHWPLQLSQACDRIQQRQIRHIDLGYAEFTSSKGTPASSYFINIADWGIGGAVVDRVNRTTKCLGGKVSFLWGIFVSFLLYRNCRMFFRLDHGEEQSAIINNFIVGNGRFFASGLQPTPQAELDDGWLDVVLFGDLRWYEAIYNMPKMRKGENIVHPKLSFYRAKTIEARSEHPVWIDMDGEGLGKLPIRVTVLPKILPICV